MSISGVYSNIDVFGFMGESFDSVQNNLVSLNMGSKNSPIKKNNALTNMIGQEWN